MQDAIYSLGNIPFAFYKNNEIIQNKTFEIFGETNRISNVKFTESNEVLVINSYPGDSYNYNITKYSAIILNPYHSGTLNTASKNFINFCICANKKNIPIFVVNLCQGFEYKSKKAFNNLNLIQLPTCSFSAIYIKLWIGLSVDVGDIVEFIKKPLAGEFLEW